jgi:GT2 family glycosyltransferase
MDGEDIIVTHASTTFSVVVIIPHLNRLEDTAACCRSLANQTHPPARILIIDNGSTEHDEAALAAVCPNARVIRLDENRGFAAAVNIGLREALADPATTHAWVLNNDTICPPETLEKLLAAVESTPDTGLAGCPMIEGKGTPNERIVAAGKTLLRPWMIPVNAKTDQVPDYISGACLLVKRKTIEDIGLLDDGFFFFFEDADYSLRAKQANWRLSVAPDVLIQHLGSATVRHQSELQARAYRTGHLRLLRKYSQHPIVFGLPAFAFRMIADALQTNKTALTGNIKGLLSSLRDPPPTHVVEPLWVAPTIPADLKRHIKVLYASHQTGTALPGYIRFALAGLAGAGYNTTLITTQQDLDVSSRSLLDKLGIELFPTENRGFDFGMWQRYLESVPAETRRQWTRILLINDSVIYFRNRFDEFIRLAEAHPADAVSLSSNTDYGFHLQSYFLYLKPAAISVLGAHLNESKPAQHYRDAVMNLEIGFSRNMTAAGLTIAPLFKTNRPFDFCYEKLIQSGAGFIKRKLLEKRYTFGQTLHFLRNDRRALDADYKTLIMTCGKPDPAFDPGWLNAGITISGHIKYSQRLYRTLFWGWTVISMATCLLLGLIAGIAARQGTGVATAALLALSIFALAMALLKKLRIAIATTTMNHRQNEAPPATASH